MRNETHYKAGGLFLRMALAVLCAALSCGITYGQSEGGSSTGSCTATRLRLEFVTGGEDCFERASTDYSIDVDVEGWRCLDPWTAQPDQTCIAKVKQEFGEQ